MNKLLLFVVITVVLLNLGFLDHVLADIPNVENVIPWLNGSDTMLNVTVYHDQETSFHLIDKVTVNINGDVRVFNLGVQPLDPVTSTFNVTLNLGSVADSPQVTVHANCNQHGPSPLYSLTIPELPTPALLLIVILAMSLLVFLQKRALNNQK